MSDLKFFLILCLTGGVSSVGAGLVTEAVTRPRCRSLLAVMETKADTALAMRTFSCRRNKKHFEVIGSLPPEETP